MFSTSAWRNLIIVLVVVYSVVGMFIPNDSEFLQMLLNTILVFLAGGIGRTDDTE